MSIENKVRIEDVSKYLAQEFRATEITIDEFLIRNKDIDESEFEDISIVLKIDNESIIQSLLSETEKEEIQITIDHLSKIEEDLKESYSLYVNEISTGKLIIVILQSKDKINLSGFVMEGAGQVLFDYLLSLIDEPLEKNFNPLDDVIEDLSHFRPYGKYFK